MEEGRCEGEGDEEEEEGEEEEGGSHADGERGAEEMTAGLDCAVCLFSRERRGVRLLLGCVGGGGTTVVNRISVVNLGQRCGNWKGSLGKKRETKEAA